MKAIALKSVLLVAALLVPTACAERIADCQPADGSTSFAGAVRCSSDSDTADVALEHEEVRAIDTEPVLSVAPPQRRKARPAAHVHSME
ncbi:hypothetical protein FHW79_001852 [Azospirillum sp. OGB3]|uniref:hypothetical protein n=1 Tax=Azospirillum sp. OGB3 TaxID=2587012 RepID=UPI0017EB6C16|nr:hypothetical protein [Azospirillum sp. OGB3]MBB3264237.1 hypothetical protein [Azospirillum sp. OGB3]